MDNARIQSFVEQLWDAEIIPELVKYIRIPNKSPLFDSQWAEHGYMDQAVELLSGWARNKLAALPGATLEVVRLAGRTPLIFIEIPGQIDDTVVLYGHLDKQPEMTGWHEDLGPWKPVLKDDRLYGRGGADDGYALFGSLASLLALREQDIPHARCVILIEACEESGSYDLPHYVDHLAARIGNPSLVVCLDSGCANYEQLWLTTSLRGMIGGDLRVEILSEGVHSGDASGVVPDSFRILRQLLSRLEDQSTGKILPAGLSVEVPEERVEQARQCAAILGDQVYSKFPWLPGAGPAPDGQTSDTQAIDGQASGGQAIDGQACGGQSNGSQANGDQSSGGQACDDQSINNQVINDQSINEKVELILNRTWRPQLAITGADGLPALDNAGNVLRPHTAVKLSLRLPPTLDCEKAKKIVEQLLEKDPPYGARVTVALGKAGDGWNAPPLSAWLAEAVSQASQHYYGKPCAYMGEGGSIPFMGMLGEKFPDAQFLITGVLGPHSNAHGPNEFLHIPTGKRVTMVVAEVLARHGERCR